MAASRRYISTGRWTTPPMETFGTVNEKILWEYIRSCEASTISGFYPLSFGQTAFHTSVPLPVVIELIMKWDTDRLIVFDEGHLFIPGLTEDIDINMGAALERHLVKTYREYRGHVDNRAWRAFLEHFMPEIEHGEQKPDPKREGGKFAAGSGKLKAENGERRTVNGQQKKPIAADPLSTLHSPLSTATDEEKVIAFFQTYRQRGTGQKCPEPVEYEAAMCYAKMEANDIPPEKQEIFAIRWIHNLIEHEQERLASYEAGFVTTDVGTKFKAF